MNWGFSTALAEAKKGNPDAAAWIYERYRARIQGQIRGLSNPFLKRYYDTLDFSQSVFLELLRDVRRVEDEGERAFAGLIRVKVRNKVLGKFRKHLDREGNQRGVPLTTDPVHPAACPVVAAETAEARTRLANALDRLDPRRRELVRLRLEERLPYGAIAERLGYPSPDAARMQHARALLAIQDACPTV